MAKITVDTEEQRYPAPPAADDAVPVLKPAVAAKRGLKFFKSAGSGKSTIRAIGEIRPGNNCGWFYFYVRKKV